MQENLTAVRWLLHQLFYLSGYYRGLYLNVIRWNIYICMNPTPNYYHITTINKNKLDNSTTAFLFYQDIDLQVAICTETPPATCNQFTGYYSNIV